MPPKALNLVSGNQIAKDPWKYAAVVAIPWARGQIGTREISSFGEM